MLTTVLSMMRYVSEIEDRDFVDRINSYFTTNLLIGLSVLVSFKQFGGKPLECLTPDIFSGSWEEYTENYCWAQDTYFVSPRVIVDGMESAVKDQKRISYYQWVPFFLLLEAACFRLPSIMWKYMSGHSGIKIRELIKLSSDPNNIKPDIRRSNIRSMTTHLQGALRFHRRVNRKQIRPHNVFRLLNLPYSARYVTCMYVLTKFFYLMNVCAQLLLMNSFLETHRYSFYGFGALLDLLNGTTWEQSGMFPRVSLCDFEVRVMGNIQEYTIQCVLVINIFNEKIFVFLWFWYLVVLILTFGSFLFWFFVSVLPCFSRSFITRHLEMGELSFDIESNEKLINRFVDSYLRADGVFVIRMTTMSSGVIFGTELVLSLWQSYYGLKFHRLKRGNSFPELGELSRVPESDDETITELGGANHKPVPNNIRAEELRYRHINFSPDSRPPETDEATAAARKAHHNPLQMIKEKLVAPPPLPTAVLRALRTPNESGVSTRTPTPSPPDVVAIKGGAASGPPRHRSRADGGGYYDSNLRQNLQNDERARLLAEKNNLQHLEHSSRDSNKAEKKYHSPPKYYKRSEHHDHDTEKKQENVAPSDSIPLQAGKNAEPQSINTVAPTPATRHAQNSPVGKSRESPDDRRPKPNEFTDSTASAYADGTSIISASSTASPVKQNTGAIEFTLSSDSDDLF